MNVQAEASSDIASMLKSALRRLPSAVTLITTTHVGSNSPAGLVASAVIPVSMNPPSMLISINQSASAHAAIVGSGQFCINLLQIEQTAFVDIFSKSESRDRRFVDEAWLRHRGLPYLSTAACSMFCEVRESFVFGTHELFIGEVRDILTPDELRDPLCWFDGAFARQGSLVQNALAEDAALTVRDQVHLAANVE